MLRAVVVGLTAIVLTATLVGCGGPEHAFAPPTPPPDGSGVPIQVGPLLVRPAAAAGFVAEEIPTGGPVSLVALSGSQINYLASQAMLDRIVYASGLPANDDLWICNLDGSNAVQLTDTNADDASPAWSPDGTTIAFDRQHPVEDREVCLIGADGSNPRALTDNTHTDGHPTWSPEGRRIAWQASGTGNDEIFVMYTDGSGVTNLTNHPSADVQPDWSPDLSNSLIAFSSTRDLNSEIYTMREDGSDVVRLTTSVRSELYPDFDPTSSRLAYQAEVQFLPDIVVHSIDGWTPPYNLSGASTFDCMPAWSSDGRFICYAATAAAGAELVVQQVDAPYQRWQITNNGAGIDDDSPDLGSPTLQTDRVIIGPAGSDWGGTNPIWSNAYGAIAAYTEDGYQNLVRIGIRAEDVHTLQVTPLAATSQMMGPAGVVIEAAEVVNLREDGGRGQPSVLWQFDALDPTAVLAYFDVWTGKLLAAMVLRDQNYPAGAGGGLGVSQRGDGDAVVVEGGFAAVFDATGARVADAAAEVRVAEGAMSVVR